MYIDGYCVTSTSAGPLLSVFPQQEGTAARSGTTDSREPRDGVNIYDCAVILVHRYRHVKGTGTSNFATVATAASSGPRRR